jgi:hypothetical protein
MSEGPRVTVTLDEEPARLLRRLLWRGTVRVVLWFVAFGLGIAAAVLATQEISSFWLGLYAFVLTMHVVGRGLGQVITKPHRFQRAVYFALMPAASIPVVWATYGAWGHMWIAVLLGFVSGAVAERTLGRLLVPRIRAEEERAGFPEGPTEDGRDGEGDVVTGEYRRLPPQDEPRVGPPGGG